MTVKTVDLGWSVEKSTLDYARLVRVFRWDLPENGCLTAELPEPVSYAELREMRDKVHSNRHWFSGSP